MESKWVVCRSTGQEIYRTSSEEDALWYAGTTGIEVSEVSRDHRTVWLAWSLTK